MKELALSQGKVALVSDEDFDVSNRFKWSFTHGYARRIEKVSGIKKRIYLHRFILDAKEWEEVDHINGDPLDNTRDNLRLCTHKENLSNKKTPSHNTSGYKGVTYFKHGKRIKRWKAEVKVDGKTKCLGYYFTPLEAATVYNQKAIEIYGEFAKINIL